MLEHPPASATQPGRASALRCERFDAGAANADDCELGCDEESVGQHQEYYGNQLQ